MRHSLARAELALTEIVYRGSDGLKKAGAKAKPCVSALPANLCVAVQVCILQERQAQDRVQDSWRTWTATCFSDALVMDPHTLSATEPLILFEVSPDCYKIRTDKMQFQVSVAKSVLDGIAAAETELVTAATQADWLIDVSI